MEIEQLGNRLILPWRILYLFRHASDPFESSSLEPAQVLLEAAMAEAASWESAVELSELISKIDGGGRGAEGRDPGLGGEGGPEEQGGRREGRGSGAPGVGGRGG